LACSGLETGQINKVSYVLQQDKIKLVLTSPLKSGGKINNHINTHGDALQHMAMATDNIIETLGALRD
jgi:4-hydroxyphenylpyruvate dioxygenase